jgi:hypothetical protein
MNRFICIANPVVVLVLICAFVYIYFFYLRGADPRSLFAPSAEPEKAWDNVAPEDRNTVALPGPSVQQQNPFDQRIQQNPINEPNQLEAPQVVALLSFLLAIILAFIGSMSSSEAILGSSLYAFKDFVTSLVVVIGIGVSDLRPIERSLIRP